MKTRWLAAIPLGLTLLLVFMVFVPVDCRLPIFSFPNSHCLVWSSAGHYESISYAYGGWGSVYEVWSYGYHIGAWAAPLAEIFWAVIGLLVLTTLLSAVMITRRLAGRQNI